MMTLNDENPFQTTAKKSSSSPYLELTIFFMDKIFCPILFLKSYGWRIPNLPTVWTYVRNFAVFLGLSPHR